MILDIEKGSADRLRETETDRQRYIPHANPFWRGRERRGERGRNRNSQTCLSQKISVRGSLLGSAILSLKRTEVQQRCELTLLSHPLTLNLHYGWPIKKGSPRGKRDLHKDPPPINSE